jgi:hypothetical protein
MPDLAASAVGLDEARLQATRGLAKALRDTAQREAAV